MRVHSGAMGSSPATVQDDDFELDESSTTSTSGPKLKLIDLGYSAGCEIKNVGFKSFWIALLNVIFCVPKKLICYTLH